MSPVLATKHLASVYTGKNAKRQGEDPLIKIEVGTDKATFHCQKKEEVSKGENRHIFFLADANCQLYFENPAAIDPDPLSTLDEGISLLKGQQYDLQVSDAVHNAETALWVELGQEKTAVIETEPKIHVP